MTTLTVSEKLKTLALDLTKAYPRSPRETLGGYVIAARTLDRCRALLNDTLGEYKYNSGMDEQLFGFTGIDPEAFKSFVATGASDEEVAEWIQQHSTVKERLDIVKWNNQMRYRTPKETPDMFQEYFEDYIEKYVPKHRPVYHIFDIFDLEEGRL